jgi:hypothetical protein
MLFRAGQLMSLHPATALLISGRAAAKRRPVEALATDCHEGGPPLVKRSAVFTNRRSTKEAQFTCCTLDSISVAGGLMSACCPGRESISTSSWPPRRRSLRRLVRRIDEVHGESVYAVVESMTGARLVHDTL